MAKTCRACNESVMEPRCYYHQKRFCYTAEDCPHWGERETPLVMDVLAKALNDMVEIFNRADDADIYPDSCQGWDAVMAAAFNALARHQEEVGDAEA